MISIVGASGGYIAGSKMLIEHMRKACHSAVYAESPSPPVICQIRSTVKLIMGEDSPSPSALDAQEGPTLSEGNRRLRRLAFNARYLRAGLRKLGFIVIGDQDSPVVPLLVYQPGKVTDSPSFLPSKHCMTNSLGSTDAVILETYVGEICDSGSDSGVSSNLISIGAGTVLCVCGTHQAGYRSGLDCHGRDRRGVGHEARLGRQVFRQLLSLVYRAGNQ